MAEELDNAILQNAQGPQSAEADGVRVTQHPLPAQIVTDKHLGAKAAGKNPIKALTRVKIVSPGTV